MTLSPHSGAAAGDAAAAGHATAAAAPPASPTMALAADPELAYLQLGGEDRERRRREYLEQDAEHMRALEEAHARLSEQNAAMHEQLQVGAACCALPGGDGGGSSAWPASLNCSRRRASLRAGEPLTSATSACPPAPAPHKQAVLAAVNEVAGENTTIKSLLAMLQVGAAACCCWMRGRLPLELGSGPALGPAVLLRGAARLLPCARGHRTHTSNPCQQPITAGQA